MPFWKDSTRLFQNNWFQFSMSKNSSCLYPDYPTLTLTIWSRTLSITSIKTIPYKSRWECRVIRAQAQGSLMKTYSKQDNIRQEATIHFLSHILHHPFQWFWRALRSLEQADRAKFLQFVTGTSKVGGFPSSLFPSPAFRTLLTTFFLQFRPFSLVCSRSVVTNFKFLHISRFPCKVSAPSKAWTVFRSSRSIETTGLQTDFRRRTLGNLSASDFGSKCCGQTPTPTIRGNVLPTWGLTWVSRLFFLLVSINWTFQPMKPTTSWRPCSWKPSGSAQKDSGLLKIRQNIYKEENN